MGRGGPEDCLALLTDSFDSSTKILPNAMKRSDCIAVAFFLLVCLLVLLFPWGMTEDGNVRWMPVLEGCFSGERTGLTRFGGVVQAYPYLMGFLKVGILATFGELLKARMKTGRWHTPDLFPKFLVWGLYGMLFTLVFALFATGVQAVSRQGLWFASSKPYAEMSFWENVRTGFSISLWCNLIFCYPMMLAHEWFNVSIAARKPVPGATFFAALPAQVWGSFLPKTIVWFWIPAHTVTFCLPPEFRVLMSAFLSLALGFLLSIHAARK